MSLFPFFFCFIQSVQNTRFFKYYVNQCFAHLKMWIMWITWLITRFLGIFRRIRCGYLFHFSTGVCLLFPSNLETLCKMQPCLFCAAFPFFFLSDNYSVLCEYSHFPRSGFFRFPTPFHSRIETHAQKRSRILDPAPLRFCSILIRRFVLHR